jgi:hypothetical protein
MYRYSIPAVLLLFSATAFADFSYQQTSRVTGGALAGVMKMAGAFSAKAREPMVVTVLVRGDRMASVSRDNIHVIDLSKETFTDIDLAKKTYSVITFDEMGELMKRAAEKMGQNKPQAELSFRSEVKETGQTKLIAGLNTRQFLVTLTTEGRDTRSGQSGTMDIQMDMWLAPVVAGYEEVRDFYARMSTRLAWSPMASAAGAFAQQNSKGLAEMMKEMSKLDGIPVLQITRMGGSGMQGGAAAPSEADQQQAAAAEQQRAQASDDARKNAAAEAITGRLGRLGGGLGGFGRKKKTEEPAPQQQQPAAEPRSAAPAGGQGVMMEITTESSAFSPAAVDASKFEVPAGFRQVDHELKKMR